MLKKTQHFNILILTLYLCATLTYANEKLLTKTTCKSQEITFNINTIFDENEPDTIFIHRWANKLHIDTKLITIENEAAFFIEKCNKTEDDLAELERHLRAKGYIRSAKVTSDKSLEKITVKTWDNWSLLPTMSFGRKGNVNTYSLGIKDSNLLGLGVDAEIESYKNDQRKGYKVKASIPLFQKNNNELKIGFADNDDGEEKALFLNKSFASFHSYNAYAIGFDESMKNDTIFQNNGTQSIFGHETSYKIINYAWLGRNSDDYTIRYNVGLNQDYHRFHHRDPSGTQTGTLVLPEDREYLYPWVGINYIEKDFKKLTNIHLISQIEDFNHGLRISSTLGLGQDETRKDQLALFSIDVNKGYELHNDGLLLLEASIDSDVFIDSSDRVLVELSGEYFYTINDSLGFYFNNSNVYSKNQYTDRPVTMGGDKRLRGYPLQYQHGTKSIRFNSELRYYPEFNILKLFEVAGVAFFDTGKAFGAKSANNIEDGWLQSVGLGLRFFSPHAGKNSVIHLDFAFPQSNNPDIDSFAIRVEAKKAF